MSPDDMHRRETSTTMTAVFLDFATLGAGVSTVALGDAAGELEVFDATAPADLLAHCAGAEAVLTNKARFDAELIAQLPDLRYIGLTATGSDNVDLVAARARGIAVTNIRDYCTDSVVQHVFGVLLSLTHNLAAYRRRVAEGAWQRTGEFCLLDFPVRELRGRTLGIIGFGTLGRAVAGVAEAFGLRVLIAERPGSDGAAGRTPLRQLLADSDVVSLHCPLNDATAKLIDADALALMRDDAVLINTARGGLVDSAALAAALRAGRLGGAAIDVLPEEPPVNGDPLLASDIPNLIVTPHIAWAAREARQRALDEAARNLAAWRAGAIRNRIELTATEPA
jgi:glycerate dehydrogenase